MDTTKLLTATFQLRHGSCFSLLAKWCFAAAPLVLSARPLWPIAASKTEAARVEMNAGPDAPAAHGEIVVKSAPNGNLQLDIKAAHLAEPSALTPAGNVYVVWLEGANENPLKLGEMRVDKNLSGEVRTITSFKHFRILITAEQNVEESSPQAPAVLSADVVQ